MSGFDLASQFEPKRLISSVTPLPMAPIAVQGPIGKFMSPRDTVKSLVEGPEQGAGAPMQGVGAQGPSASSYSSTNASASTTLQGDPTYGSQVKRPSAFLGS